MAAVETFERAEAQPAAETLSPTGRRINRMLLLLACVFVALGLRAVQLSFDTPPERPRPAASTPGPDLVRADLVDRNGVLLAATLPGFVLAAEPAKVWDAAETARRIAAVLPGLEAAEIEQKLRSDKRLVYLRRGLTATQKQALHDLGLAGVVFVDEKRRVYPNGMLAGHLLGFVDRKEAGAAGVERALDPEIRRAAAAGKPFALSIDLRIQYAVESELADAAWGAKAKGGAAILLDGKTGETLAMASWPQVDPNQPAEVPETTRLNRAAGAVYEMGSALKPFTAAMAMDAGVLRLTDRFDLTRTLTVDGVPIRDPHPFTGPATVREAMAYSSNVAMAEIALRVGAERQRAVLQKLGLFHRAPIELPESAPPLRPRAQDRVTTAILGYGHGAAQSLVAVAGAYTVFANGGARVNPTLIRHTPGDPVRSTPVFTELATRETLALMRDVVVEGTAKKADLGGLDIAGKTGTAEKPGKDGKYDPDRMFSSFAAVFPASAPRYVLVVALDEPQRTEENGNMATGGAVAAPAVGRIVARIAPFLASADREGQDRAGGPGAKRE